MRYFQAKIKNYPVLTMAVLFIFSFFVQIRVLEAAKNEEAPIRVGYFHGGRTALLMRAYENNEFDAAGLKVDFYSRGLREENYALVPKSIIEFHKEGGEGIVGKVRGTELIDGVMDGHFDLAMVGESSFIYAVHDGKPIVGIAELGHDVKGHSGHVFLMRNGIKIEKPQDYLGKLLVSRRAGPGDAIFMKEFLEKEGINLERDILQLKHLPSTIKEKGKLPKNKVIIVDDLMEDVMDVGIANGVIDGGYFHLMSFEGHPDGPFYLIQPLHYWANPELSMALLVCRKDFLEENRPRLVKFMEAYIKRIKYEHGLTYEERTRKRPKGLQMAANVRGLNYPQYDLIPTLSPGLLNEIIFLLRKYKYIDKKNISIDDFIDNSLVLKAAKNLGVRQEDDYWQSEY